MNPDLALILGLIVGGFAIVGMFSALSDGRSPRASALTVLISGGLLTYALVTKPGGYTLAELPNVFFSVVATMLP